MPIKFSMKNKTYSKPVAGQYTCSSLYSCFSITYKMQLSILWDSDAIVTAIIFQYFCSSLLEATPDSSYPGQNRSILLDTCTIKELLLPFSNGKTF